MEGVVFWRAGSSDLLKGGGGESEGGGVQENIGYF